MDPTLSPKLSDSLACAAPVLAGVLTGASLTALLTGRNAPPPALRPAVQDLAYSALRQYGVVDALLERLLERPLQSERLRGLLMAALADLIERPASSYTVVNQAVEAAQAMGETRAKGLVNAVLRNFLRQQTELLGAIQASDTGRYRHPQWWIDELRRAWPSRWEEMLAAANSRGPMTLRVNVRRSTVERTLARLAEAGLAATRIGDEAILLERPQRVHMLPGFAEGEISVQDAGAQRAAHFLDVRPGQRVLDACAAPGGKTCHVLERVDCELLALDDDSVRTRRIRENLARLGLQAEIKVGDAGKPETFGNEKAFDRILADVPCTASGVSRRHPDIRWLRRKEDIASFARAQARLLDALWQVLIPGGKLLYATCSLFPMENGEQIRTFLSRHDSALQLPLGGLEDGQIFPGAESDGFFYALLQKTH
jgi:16S rRNA (cytosine967-C5)-methyltransferase